MVHTISKVISWVSFSFNFHVCVSILGPSYILSCFTQHTLGHLPQCEDTAKSGRSAVQTDPLTEPNSVNVVIYNLRFKNGKKCIFAYMQRMYGQKPCLFSYSQAWFPSLGGRIQVQSSSVSPYPRLSTPHCLDFITCHTAWLYLWFKICVPISIKWTWINVCGSNLQWVRDEEQWAVSQLLPTPIKAKWLYPGFLAGLNPNFPPWPCILGTFFTDLLLLSYFPLLFQDSLWSATYLYLNLSLRFGFWRTQIKRIFFAFF